MAETTNQEQIRYWNEQGGPKWVLRQQQLDAQIHPLGLVALQRAAIQLGERVVDIGCGCGQTSLELAERVGPKGFVLGIDISQPMLNRARERQKELGVTNLEFLQADAQTHQFSHEQFNVIFSRFGVMFFEEPNRCVWEFALSVASHWPTHVPLLASAGKERLGAYPVQSRTTTCAATSADGTRCTWPLCFC